MLTRRRTQERTATARETSFCSLPTTVPQNVDRVHPSDAHHLLLLHPSIPGDPPSTSPTAIMVAFFKTDSVPYRPLFSAPRSLSSKFFALLALFSVVCLATYLLPSSYKPNLPSLGLPSGRQRGTCTPQSWAAGQWVSKPPPTTRTNLTKPEEAYEFLGLEGCASSREHWWHLAADKPELYDRFPGVASWSWSPPSDCAVRDLDPSAIVKDLVEQGGWFLIGGECHAFYSFHGSCAAAAVRAMASPRPLCLCAGSGEPP